MADNRETEKVIIVGSGPAAWTAAIYAARAALDPLVYEGQPSSDNEMIPGGQLMFTTEVENYPGFPEGIDGQKMMADFRAQAQRFDVRIASANGTKVDFSKRPFTLWADDGSERRAHAVIVATGASANWLGLESEQRFRKAGLGVTACATCDGAFPRYRGKPIAVIGGGDAAMEEAIYMTRFSGPVYIVHRRDQLRASKIMQSRALKNPDINVLWDSVVDEVLGDDTNGVTALKLRNVKTDDVRELSVSGMFLALGHTPNTAFLDEQVDMNEKGYITLPDPSRMMTSVTGVFAAGDVADAVYRQAVVAAGMGCKAAIDAERWLAEQGLE